jgi:UDP-N-acetylmuramate--alanine ligase
MEPGIALEIFRTFASRCREAVFVSDDPALSSLGAGAIVFGFGSEAHLRATDLWLAPEGSRFRIDGIDVEVPLPGAHNAGNALAALVLARHAGIELSAAAEALRHYQGVSRRFESLGRRGGVEVIDDYAHNPTKIGAAVAAGQARGDRLLAFFQPHGFAPTQFQRAELVQVLARQLRRQDRIWLGEIFYAGGTVSRALSSLDLVQELGRAGVNAAFLPDRQELRSVLPSVLRPGDVVLVMGGRDPSLGAFARSLLSCLPAEPVSI